MAYHNNWYVLTCVMIASFSFLTLLIVFQIISDRWNKQRSPDDHRSTKQTISIYAVYFMSLECALQCFTMHYGDRFPHWYCYGGMPFCIIAYSACKASLYNFFLFRASLTQDVVEILEPIWFEKILPGWIIAYIACFCILCPIFYRGEVGDPSAGEDITGCLFEHTFPWLFLLAGAVDLCNCSGFVYLFYMPWKRGLAMAEDLFHETSKTEFLAIVRRNVILTAISSASSVTLMILLGSSAFIADTAQYAWLGGNIDLMINATCVYFMIGPNRNFVSAVICRRNDGQQSVKAATAVMKHKLTMTKMRRTKQGQTTTKLTLPGFEETTEDEPLASPIAGRDSEEV